MKEPENKGEFHNPSKGPNQGDSLKNNPNYSSASDPRDITDSAAEDGSSDGIANKTAGSGSNNGGPGGRVGSGTGSDDNEGRQGGGESKDQGQRSPSHQTEHGAHASKGQGGSGGGGNGGQGGSMSGNS